MSSVSSVGPFGGLNGYWGQYGSDPMKSYCDSGVEYISIAFVNRAPEHEASGWPGTNFAGHCPGYSFRYGDALQYESNLWEDCYLIQEGIPYCQNLGVKVLLSIGGDYNEATSNYEVTSEDNGREFADLLYKMYGPKQDSWDGPRPFDSLLYGPQSVNGFDFDIEKGFGTYDANTGYDNSPYIAMIDELRTLDSSLIITAAPQCPIATQYFYMKELIQTSKLDALFIQFYNNENCDLIGSGANAYDNFNYEAWEQILAGSDQSKDAKIFVGLPADSSAAGTGYVTPDVISEVVQYLKDKASFGGLSLWDLNRGASNKDEDGKSFNDAVLEGLGITATPPSPTTTAETTTAETTTAETTTAQTTTTETTTTETATTETTTAESTTAETTTAETTTAETSTAETSTAETTTSSTDVSTAENTPTGPYNTPTGTSTGATTDSTSTGSDSTSTGPNNTPTDTPTGSATDSTSTGSDSTSTGPNSTPTDTLTGSATDSTSTGSGSTSTGPHNTPTGTPTGSATESTYTVSDSTPIGTPTGSATDSTSAGTPTGPATDSTSVGTPTDSTSAGTPTDSTSTGSDNTSTGSDTTSIGSDSTPIGTPTDSTPTGSDSTALGSATDSTATGSATDSTASGAATDSTATGTEATSSATDSTSSSAEATGTDSTASGALTTSVPSGRASTTESASMTTSTVYTTHVYTVTKCPASVTNCPANPYVTTEVVALYTTVCPVTEAGKPATKTSKASKPDVTYAAVSEEVKTVYTTKVHTITKCPAYVTDCPVGSVTTEVSSYTTTIAHVTETTAAIFEEEVPEVKTVYTTKVHTITKCPAYVTDCPVGSVTTEISSWTTTVAKTTETATIEVPDESVPEETTTVKATSTIYTTVTVPPATLEASSKPIAAATGSIYTSVIVPAVTLETSSKPSATTYESEAETTYKRPEGVAAPTGGCVGEGCSATTYAYPSSPSATIQPVTAGASTLGLGMTAVIAAAALQMFAL